MLGRELRPELARRGHEPVAPPRQELDITDPESVARIAAGHFGPIDWVVNAAAYTAVDRAESDVDEAFRVNAYGPGLLARACAALGVPLLHVSTDFVFDGKLDRPYRETDSPHPLGVYARSKHRGEEAILAASAYALVARTAWLFGPHGRSFPKTILRAWLRGQPLRVVADQRGSPTYAADLARVLVDLIEKRPDHGIYHTAGPEILTWHELAVRTCRAYAKAHGLDRPVTIEPIRTEDWPTPAPRPAQSALSFEKCAALGIEPMRPLEAALGEFCGRLPDPDTLARSEA